MGRLNISLTMDLHLSVFFFLTTPYKQSQSIGERVFFLASPYTVRGLAYLPIW